MVINILFIIEAPGASGSIVCVLLIIFAENHCVRPARIGIAHATVIDVNPVNGAEARLMPKNEFICSILSAFTAITSAI